MRNVYHWWLVRSNVLRFPISPLTRNVTGSSMAQSWPIAPHSSKKSPTLTKLNATCDSCAIPNLRACCTPYITIPLQSTHPERRLSRRSARVRPCPWITLSPSRTPMADSPMTRMNAGIRTAHSRDGNHWCTGLDASKNGWCSLSHDLNTPHTLRCSPVVWSTPYSS